MSKSLIRIPGRRRTFFLGFAENKLQGRGSNFFFVFLLLGYEIISQVFWIFRGISEIFKNFQPFSILRGIRFVDFNRVHRVVSGTRPSLPICTELYWVSTDSMHVSYLVSVSTRFGPRRL